MGKLKILTIAASLGVAMAANAFEARDVEIVNREDNVTLAGTLATPADTKAKAAIVLASGSGAQDRDETLLPAPAVRQSTPR